MNEAWTKAKKVAVDTNKDNKVCINYEDYFKYMTTGKVTDQAGVDHMNNDNWASRSSQ